MKKIISLALITLAISISASAEENYSNFPTITSDFQSKEVCHTWLAEKTAKYGERVISAASGCTSIRVRELTSGSVHAPSFKTKIVGTVVLDTL